MDSITHNKASRMRCSPQGGFSLMELVIVMVIIGILSTMALMSFTASKKLQATDDQAVQLMDFMRDANIQALSKRRIFRLEIDVNDNQAKLIDENGAGTADDRMVRWMPFEVAGVVRVDSSVLPTGVTTTGLPANYNAMLFGTDPFGHWRGNTRISGHSVWSIRFRSDGSLVSNSDAISSATLYMWPAKDNLTPYTPLAKSLVRAITLFGPTGGIKLWKYNGTQFNAG